MRFVRVLWLLCLIVHTGIRMNAQTDTYILNGSAQQNNCNCYTLTTATNNQSGSVWNKNKISLTQPFDFIFNVFLGCSDAGGADGLVFILQPISTSIGSSGGGMGFLGVSPSVGIALDTWQNFEFNDPDYDHISIQANGNITHGSDIAGPVLASVSHSNIEDCQWHTLRIKWNPVTKELSGFFDGALRVTASIDMVKDIFGNDPQVFWGFSAATGGANNLQQFCTALNPKTILLSDSISCIQPGGNTVIFKDQSESFAPITKYFWDFGDGTVSSMANPDPHTYKLPGIYPVKMAITGKDGCQSDTLLKKIVIGSVPKADFLVYDTCQKADSRIINRTSNTVGAINKWLWTINDLKTDTTSDPMLQDLAPGPYKISLQVTSEYGCSSSSYLQNFLVKERPEIQAFVADGCKGIPVAFKNMQIDNRTNIKNWFWNFGDGSFGIVPSPTHRYNSSGAYRTQTWAIADNGCSSDTLILNVRISQAFAFAGNDTIVSENDPFLLQGDGNGSFSWFPSQGLDDATIQKPTAVLNNDQRYIVTVTSPEGCVATDTVNIIVFKGSAIYVPNAFTPNNDGRNDLFKPKYVGIKTLEYFTVFDRWGNMIFKTSDLSIGWDGTYKGRPAINGTYVWMLNAVDFINKKIQKKGTVTIIK